MKRIFFSGLMLMSFFFGAGNLIFAPSLGLEAGTNFLPAVFGFNLSAALLPLLAIIAVVYAGDSTLSIAGRIGRTYGLVFTVIIIFSIGPLFGIPRVANVSYETGIAPLFAAADGTTPSITSAYGLGYIAFFFGLSFLLALYGEKAVDTIGAFLSPALVIFIFALIIGYLASGDTTDPTTTADAYVNGAVGHGALQGYQTLDAVAAFAFAGLIITTFKKPGEPVTSAVLKQVLAASAVAVFFLAVIYVGLAYLGNQASHSGKTAGADILVYASQVAFGSTGKAIFAIIVFLACLTTAVGLLKTIASYCYNLFGLMSEFAWLVFFTITSALFSVQGLSQIIKLSVPMIYLTYPITICLTIVTLANSFFQERAWVYRLLGVFVTPVALADGIKVLTSLLGYETPVDILGFLRDVVPFMNTDFSWVCPLLLAVVVGSVMPKVPTKTYLIESYMKK